MLQRLVRHDPVEIEDKLNTLPYSESIVIQRGEKLYGLVHPDYDEAERDGLEKTSCETSWSKTGRTSTKWWPTTSS